MKNKEKIIKLAKLGLSCTEVARELGLSKQYVSQVVIEKFDSWANLRNSFLKKQRIKRGKNGTVHSN